jgi:hypothetical protein
MIPTADRLKMQTYTVEVLTNPPCYMIALGLAKVERKSVQIQGYTLKDAKKRVGIE